MSKNALCPLIQTPLALMSDLASSEWFPLISSPDNVWKSGSTLTSLLTASSISAMLSLNSLCLGVTNPPFLHDLAYCMFYGFEQPQWLESLFSGSPYLKRTTSQKSNLDKLNSSRLMGKIVNQLDDPCSCAISFNLISMKDILSRNTLRVLCCFSIRFFCIFDLIFFLFHPLILCSYVLVV